MNAELTSVWISANAGSGKTRALVDRVVRLLLAGVAPERICCITYTKAAANEMRERIVTSLRELLIADDTVCAKKLAELGVGEGGVARARQLFAAVLDSPFGGVQLTTIHGFCQQLLKKFPLEAGIPPLFTILDDAGRDRLQRAARHRLFDMAEETPLSQSIRLLAERSGEARVEALLDGIEQRHGEWNRVLNQQSPEHVAGLIYAAHGVPTEMTANGLHEQFVQTLVSADEVKQLRAALPEFLGHKNKTEQNLGAILAPWLEAFPTENSELTDALLGHFVTQKYTANRKSISKAAPLPELLARIREQCVAHRRQLAALSCAEESAALAQVAFSYRRLLQQLKFDAQTLDYDDLIQRATELLCGPMIGWVMRKLDHRIDHLLIDEAQDTSPDQWRIARALVEELIATNDAEIPRTLLVVGDEKQSIFSFQGAAPEYFAREAQYFQQLLSESSAPLARSNLQTSYRSANAVLQLVDTVAELPAVATALSESGASAPHQLHRTDAAGLVRMYSLVIANEKPKLEPFRIPTEYLESQSAAAMLANQIAEQIAGWLAENRCAPADILILVHRRRPMAQALIHALEHHRVPVSGMDRLTLSNHLAVRDVMALMAWCMHPADDLSLAHVLRSPIIGMSDEALRAIAVSRDASLWEALQDSGMEYTDELQKLYALRHVPPYEFLTQLLEVHSARRRFAERFGAEVHEILDELKSQAAQIPAGMVASIAYFYDWVMASDRVIKREPESGANTVQIMTVHGAKGLEAPIVIMADTMSVPDLKKEGMYFADTAHGQRIPLLALSEEAKFAALFEQAKEVRKAALEAEYQRLLYVALTRARDELHVYGFANKEPKSADDTDAVTSWYHTVRAAFKQLPDAVELEDGTWEYRDAFPPPIGGRLGGGRQMALTQQQFPAFLTQPPARPAPVRSAPLSPSRMGARMVYHGQANPDAVARGVRIHRVLQWLRPESDVASLVKLAAPEWDDAMRQRACEEISGVVSAHAWLWSSPSQAEASLAGAIEIHGTMQSFVGQIDRIVETPDAFVIVDFKTGQPSSTISENYLLQFKVYQALLQPIYPEKPVRCALLWTATAQLQWLDEQVAQTPWPPLQNLMENSADSLDAYGLQA